MLSEKTAQKIGEWVCNGNTGTSSKTMLAVWLGAKPERVSYPSDIGDFIRCRDLLENVIPAHMQRPVLDALGHMSPKWQAIADNWVYLVKQSRTKSSQEACEAIYKVLDEADADPSDANTIHIRL